MSLPSTVRVKISSEGAEMAVTPVVSQDMSLDELAFRILGITGKDPTRVREVLQRGSVVVGASRLRWGSIVVDDTAVRDLLVRFPDPEPSRPFDERRCVEIVLIEGRRAVPISADAARKRRWLQRRSFWDVVLDVAPAPEYRDYSYKESADVYVAVLTAAQHEAIQDGLRLLTFPVRLTAIEAIAFRVPRV